MFYSEKELKEIFDNNKKMIDRAYLYTKLKYGAENANIALYEYFTTDQTSRITRGNDSRKNMEALTYHYYETEQFIMEYAMSSYIANDMQEVFSLNDIYTYANDPNNPNLKYDDNSIVTLVALAAAWSPYWLTNLLACNDKVKTVLIKRLITERYVEGQKQKLDNSRRSKLVTLPNGKKLMLSIDKLNHDIDNMIRDDEAIYLKDELMEKEDSHKKGVNYGI